MIRTIKSGAGVSRYLRLYRVLSQALSEGSFGVGEALPSEPRLMRDYGISRSTVRRALAQLEAEARIERRRGSGTFAREQVKQPATSRDLSALLDGSTTPPKAVVGRTLTSLRLPTPAFLPAEQPGFGASVLLIRRIRYVGREPLVLESTYLPEEIGSGLTRKRLGTNGDGILTLLATLGHQSASTEREFAALETDPLTAESLNLVVGEPVFNVRTLARDRRHRILAYVDCLYRPDRYEARTAVEIAEPTRRRRVERRP